MQTEPISKITNEKKDKASKMINLRWKSFDFCDYSMTLREMTDILLTSGHFWTPPPPHRLGLKKVSQTENCLFFVDINKKAFTNLRFSLLHDLNFGSSYFEDN